MASSGDKDLAYVTSYEQSQGSSTSQEPQTTNQNPWWRFGGRDRIFVPSRLEGSRSTQKAFQGDRTVDDDYTADGNVFSDPKAIAIYEPIEKYEGRHRFDIHATWSDEEERNLVRRVSVVVLSITLTEY